jgi:hypothetical protein
MKEKRRVRELLGRHGRLRSQRAGEWTGPFTLPTPLVSFYAEVGPVDIEIPGYGNPCFLPSLAGLWDLQAGYRWHGNTGERLDDWDDDWLVVAYEGGDPFICERSSGRILHAYHGEGSWEPEEMFPGVLTMAACFAVIGGVVADAGLELTNERSRIRAVHRKRAEQELRAFLGSASEVEAVLGSLGWG